MLFRSGDTWYRILSPRPVDTAMLAAAGFIVADHGPEPEQLDVSMDIPRTRLSDAVRLVSDFLTASSIPCTVRNEGDGKAFTVSDKGRKKRNVIDAAVYSDRDGSTVVRMTCGVKCDLGELGSLARKRNMVFSTHVRLLTDR